MRHFKLISWLWNHQQPQKNRYFLKGGWILIGREMSFDTSLKMTTTDWNQTRNSIGRSVYTTAVESRRTRWNERRVEWGGARHTKDQIERRHEKFHVWLWISQILRFPPSLPYLYLNQQSSFSFQRSLGSSSVGCVSRRTAGACSVTRSNYIHFSFLLVHDFLPFFFSPRLYDLSLSEIFLFSFFRNFINILSWARWDFVLPQLKIRWTHLTVLDGVSRRHQENAG